MEGKTEMTENHPGSLMEGEIHYCQVHSGRDTELRCNRCNRYMCVDCAVRTSVGYTCRECVRGHEDKFFEGTLVDYAVVAAVSAIGGAMGVLGSALIGGFLLLVIIVGPALGGIIGQVALALTGRRRGRQSGYVCAGGVLAGGMAAGLLGGGLGITTLLFLALATSTAYASFKASI